MKLSEPIIIYFALVAFIAMATMSIHMHLNRLERKIDSICAKPADAKLERTE